MLKRPKETSYDQEQEYKVYRHDFSNEKRVLFKDIVSKAKEQFKNQELHVMMSLERGVGVTHSEECEIFDGAAYMVFVNFFLHFFLQDVYATGIF